MICFKVKLPNLIMEHFYRRCQLWRLRIKIVSIYASVRHDYLSTYALFYLNFQY